MEKFVMVGEEKRGKIGSDPTVGLEKILQSEGVRRRGGRGR